MNEIERLVIIALDGGDYRAECPGSRYSLTAGMCAVWAAVHHQAFLALGGVPDDDDEWESRAVVDSMSMVVNDNADVARTISEAWNLLPRSSKQCLGRTVREIRRMI